MGYSSYEPRIYMLGSRAERKKAFSFLKAFFENDDQALANDAMYQAFREEMDVLWGERGADYDDIEGREMGMSGDATRIEAWFCRFGDMESSSHYLTPLCKAFPDIHFYINGYLDWFNNADELSSRNIEENGFYQGKEFGIEIWYEDDGQLLEDEKPTTLKDVLKGVVDEENPKWLIFVPEERRTSEFFMDLVKKQADLLEYVPNDLKTVEMCLEAVQNSDGGAAFEYVPEELRTAELYLEAIKQNNNVLNYVPEDLEAQVQAALENPETYAQTSEPSTETSSPRPCPTAYSSSPRLTGRRRGPFREPSLRI